jgi:hypothetical protein
MDQVSYAHWADPQLAAQAAKQQGVPPTAPQRAGASPAVAQQAPPGQPGALQQPAPLQPPAVPALPAKPAGAPPIAQGFIDRVNSKFDGDISKALFDPETRGWAKTVGLVPDSGAIFDSDLSSDRVDVVRKILKDPGLDPLSKLDAVKILLRNSSSGVSR